MKKKKEEGRESDSYNNHSFFLIFLRLIWYPLLLLFFSSSPVALVLFSFSLLVSPCQVTGMMLSVSIDDDDGQRIRHATTPFSSLSISILSVSSSLIPDSGSVSLLKSPRVKFEEKYFLFLLTSPPPFSSSWAASSCNLLLSWYIRQMMLSPSWSVVFQASSCFVCQLSWLNPLCSFLILPLWLRQVLFSQISRQTFELLKKVSSSLKLFVTSFLLLTIFPNRLWFCLWLFLSQFLPLNPMAHQPTTMLPLHTMR